MDLAQFPGTPRELIIRVLEPLTKQTAEIAEQVQRGIEEEENKGSSSSRRSLRLCGEIILLETFNMLQIPCRA
jgi:hypothetical protein